MTEPYRTPTLAELVAPMIAALESAYTGPPEGRALYIAEAFEEAGYLTPSSVSLERGYRDSEGKHWSEEDGLPGHDTPVHRYVSDWMADEEVPPYAPH